MTVDLVPNHDIYEDIYPSISDESDNETDYDDSSSDTEPDVTKNIAAEIGRLRQTIDDLSEERNSATSRLGFLDNFGRSLALPSPRSNELGPCIDSYRTERQKAYESYRTSLTAIGKCEKELRQKLKEKERRGKPVKKEKEKARKVRAKKQEKQERVREEKIRAKNQLKQERVQFWPRKVYRIILSLDMNPGPTPAPSRRGSVDTIGKPAVSVSPNADVWTEDYQIAISVSYITHSASWFPRYDLSLMTASRSGTIIYRAEFCNTTSETWSDAKVILSTSQTSFHGLGERIPTLSPWHIRLMKAFGENDDSSALYSRSEQDAKRKGRAELTTKASEPRSDLFGLEYHSVQNNRGERNSVAYGGLFGLPAGHSAYAPSSNNFQQHQQQVLFGQQKQFPQQQRQQAQAQFPAQAQLQPVFASAARDQIDYSDEEMGLEETIVPRNPTLSFQESTWEESGFTASYEVPGLRTIPPSNLTRRHRIASIALKDVQLSHVLVPKLRAAAFLKARLRNTSSITLLKGLTGLTLDGSFLGNTILPRCGAGEGISLSMGVDPGVGVEYLTPSVRRSQSGVFQKEGSSVYTRTCIIRNLKGNGAIVEGSMIDQVPVSEEEKLRVEVIVPRRLRGEGDPVKCGTAVERVGNASGSMRGSVYSMDGTPGSVEKDERWGNAVATLKKGGEVCWDFKVNPGQGVRLVLEYEARFPGSETVVGV